MYYSSSSPFYEDEWFSVKKLLYMLYPYQNIQCVDWIQGACFFLRRDQFLAVQGFRKEYFVYTEDMALARDFNDHGWQSRILKDHWVYHPRRALNGDKFKRICTNLVHYFQGKDPGPYHRHLKLKAMAGQIPFEWLLHFEKTLKLRL